MKPSLEEIDNASLVAEMLARLDATRSPPLDWVAAYASGDAVKNKTAGEIAVCHPDTIGRWAEDAAKTDSPLGILLAKSVWLISMARLLDQSGRTKGPSARLEAEPRAQKSAEMLPPQHLSTRFGAVAPFEG